MCGVRQGSKCVCFLLPMCVYHLLRDVLSLLNCLDPFVKNQLRRKRAGAPLEKSIGNVSISYISYIFLDLIYYFYYDFCKCAHER